jgi:hypothetical protein
MFKSTHIYTYIQTIHQPPIIHTYINTDIFLGWPRTCRGSCPRCGRRTWRATSLLQTCACFFYFFYFFLFFYFKKKRSRQSVTCTCARINICMYTHTRSHNHKSPRTEVEHGRRDPRQLIGEELDHVIQPAQVPPRGVPLKQRARHVGPVEGGRLEGACVCVFVFGFLGGTVWCVSN